VAAVWKTVVFGDNSKESDFGLLVIVIAENAFLADFRLAEHLGVIAWRLESKMPRASLFAGSRFMIFCQIGWKMYERISSAQTTLQQPFAACQMHPRSSG
jgi:hypothetical protein